MMNEKPKWISQKKLAKNKIRWIIMVMEIEKKDIMGKNREQWKVS